MAYIDDVWYPSERNTSEKNSKKLNEFISVIGKAFPNTDFDYSFKNNKFIKEETNKLYRVWLLGIEASHLKEHRGGGYSG